MQLLASPPLRRHQMRGFEDAQMLGDGLTGHVEVFRQLAERLAVVVVEPIEQLPAARIRKRLEHRICVTHERWRQNMQVSTCMSSTRRVGGLALSLRHATRIRPCGRTAARAIAQNRYMLDRRLSQTRELADGCVAQQQQRSERHRVERDRAADARDRSAAASRLREA